MGLPPGAPAQRADNPNSGVKDLVPLQQRSPWAGHRATGEDTSERVVEK
jgi:hypothetical protein